MTYYVVWALIYFLLGLAWFDRHPDVWKIILKHSGSGAGAVITGNIVILTWIGWCFAYQHHLRRERLAKRNKFRRN
jgi:EamA domain-containing membrane protein RarD